MLIHRPTIVACLMSLVACANQPRATTIDPVAAAPDRVWFTGSSNIRHFTCSAKQVNVSAEAAIEEFDRTRRDGLPAVRRAALQVPVRSLDCGIGLQNSHLFETLDAGANPSITFVLGDYAVNSSAAGRQVTMKGALRIAGVERNIVLHGQVLRDGDGHFTLSGDRAINVRDFGVKPPRRFLGLFRVRDEVTVHFLIWVRPLIDPLGILTASL